MAGIVFMWAGLVVPWISLFFLDGKVVRRYLPAALAVTVLNTITSQLAWKYHWWTIVRPMFPWSQLVDVPLVYGAFLVGTIWILAYTFRRFWLFLVVNLLIDALFAFGISWLVEYLQLITIQLGKWQLYSLVVGSALLLYVFQLWYENKDVEITVGMGRRART